MRGRALGSCPRWRIRGLASESPCLCKFAVPNGRTIRALSGSPATSTAELENKALAGRAGQILAALGAEVEARELVRTTGVPAGVVAMDGTLFVNASWLVALSAIERPPELGPAAPPIWVAPPKAPQSVRANPYKLPSSVAECGFDVKDVCTCAPVQSCTHQQTDPTFGTAQQECDWVNGADGRAEALCVLALMSIEAIRDCVRTAGTGCTQTLVASRDDALAFVAEVACVDALDICLSGGPSSPPSSGGGSGSNVCNSCDCDGCDCSNCDSGGDNCNNDCDQCNNDCSKCNQNCSECNQNCKDCNDNCEQCDENSKNCRDGQFSASVARGASYCRMASARKGRSSGGSNGPIPFGTVLWFLLPVGYIARRARRRA